ncbi:argininosuccinate lyase [Agromyces silvae]|uniref:argininosuccinate lyase n=1 Tax=Agromyces silvae TaxID=3388266 RepID=UPI00280AD45F|nr:argininosuccinate lyase [Agromyces protaetiae]
MTERPTQLWGGRFSSGPSEALRRFSRSPERYFSLAPYDLQGSRAHVRELNRAGLIDDAELALITTAIDELTADVLTGATQPIEADEDVHTFLERELIERLGPLGGKVRAGRSRNDQAANDLRLYLRDQARTVAALLVGLIDALADQAERSLDLPVPGFTHLQPAQPVVFAHQLLAHAQPLVRDLARLRHWDERAGVSPLGAAALAGSTFSRSPETSAAELGYAGVAENSIDAVASRDVPLEFLFISSLAFVDLSRLCEEITMWASVQFGWIRLDDAWCTGSSIMPQKKNPDIAELARGRAGQVLGDLVGLMATVKSLPLAYNRDLIGDKHAVLDAVESFELALPALTGLVATFTPNAERMRADATKGFTLATEAADWLARRGVPFSEAHEVSGAMVRYCEERGIELHEIPESALAGIDERLTADVLPALTLEAALAAHDATGGTAPARVAEQLTRVRAAVAAFRTWIDAYDGPRF